MIDFLRGKIAAREPEYVVVDVHGVGYRVFCSNPYVFGTKEEVDVTLYTHYHVREDAHLLFGFPTREEQVLFRQLIDVSGIGPKVALGILAGGKPETVVAAIQQENIAFLTKLPGIGKKTAQRLIFDLKEKLGKLTVTDHDLAVSFGLIDPQDEVGAQGVWGEVKQGLLALGYTDAEADRAWARIQPKIKDSDPADVIMKQALQALFQL
ncbi:Holliday junction branch migration protein RuvA [Paenibacillus lutrae]|uniref:Holliday junction branch migration complex subunit RuvA n=1 Tax=Paenibacillus lutrae TaxID=2078573 RepID=A0A7X3FHE7_9BACL|nr:Holliday junction branch migration protein RuvA [Paenibacillus lutrae]MVO99657.1 Holliday junction branch migration protein RuvA [Paenibacillus lutrae]